jgi:hypothetical protein
MSSSPQSRSRETPPSADGVLERARQKGVVLWVANEALHFRAPNGALDDGLRHELASHKPELIELLSGPRFIAGEPQETSPVLHYNHGLWAKIVDRTLTEVFTNGPRCICLIEGPLELDAVRAAVATLVERHRILGARVVESADGPHFHFNHPVDVRFVDMSKVGALRRRAATRDLMHELVWTPFDVGRETMFRPFVVRLAKHKHVVGFVLNHFAGDGWSVNLLAGELMRLSAGVESGARPRRTLQYADYIREINRWVRTPGMRNRVAWWKETLRGAPSSLLPPDFVVDPDTTGHFRKPGYALNPRQLNELRELASSTGVTLYAVMLAAKALALGRLCEIDDVVILTMFHGRTEEALFDLVGGVQMQVPIRIRLEPRMSFQELARSTLEACTRAYSHLVPYGWIRATFEEIGTAGRFAEFNFIDRQAFPVLPGDGSAAQLRIRPYPVTTSPPDPVTSPKTYVPHAMFFEENDLLAGMTVYLDYIYSEKTIQRFHQWYFRILDHAVDDPDGQISSWQLA